MMEDEGHLVSDIMKKMVISIDEAKTIKDAANMMNEARIGSIINKRQYPCWNTY
jgi:predicted transcriptional regulator